MSSNTYMKIISIICIPILCRGQDCTMPKIGTNILVHCSNCNDEAESDTVKTGTVLKFSCPNFFQIKQENSSHLTCLENGEWSSPVPECMPKCGKLASALPLVVHGKVIPGGLIPWQSVLYHNNGQEWEFWCGGSLISPTLVLTAAHCAWEISPKALQVGFGKFMSNITAEEDEKVQIIQAKQIDMIQSYQDISGNFNGDLAVITLEKPVTFSEIVSPVCIDWGQQFVDQQVQEGKNGVAAGWGLTENETFSDELRSIKLPVVSDLHCIEKEQQDFRKYITYTSFCAGYNNGSGVCNGDSGGGLAFLDETSDTWYLQGVVSVSPRKRGTTFCDPSYYTIFTKVAVFTKWLQKMFEKEGAVIPTNLIT